MAELESKVAAAQEQLTKLEGAAGGKECDLKSAGKERSKAEAARTLLASQLAAARRQAAEAAVSAS